MSGQYKPYRHSVIHPVRPSTNPRALHGLAVSDTLWCEALGQSRLGFDGLDYAFLAGASGPDGSLVLPGNSGPIALIAAKLYVTCWVRCSRTRFVARGSRCRISDMPSLPQPQTSSYALQCMRRRVSSWRISRAKSASRSIAATEYRCLTRENSSPLLEMI